MLIGPLLRLALPAPLIVISAAMLTAEAAPPLRGNLASHRAVYEINLARTEEGSGVSSASGRMVFEVTGNACDGYRMRQRMVVNIGDEEGNLGLLDFRIATFESSDGDLYSFDSRTTVNEKVVEAVEGEARRLGSNIEVKLKQPLEKTVILDGEALFPSQHLQAIIEAAAEDRNFLSVDIYEGAGAGDASDAAAAAIGSGARSSRDNPLTANLRHWPVSVGYFGDSGDDDGASEELPSYQMSFTLYENGITNDIVMDYGDYALAGSLQEIEPIAGRRCLSR